MKRFLVFCGEEYYPTGGWNDIAGWMDDYEIAVKACDEIVADGSHYSWAHVVDLEKGQFLGDKIVYSASGRFLKEIVKYSQ